MKLSQLPITIHCQTQADDISEQTGMLELRMMEANLHHLAVNSDADELMVTQAISTNCSISRMLTISNLSDWKYSNLKLNFRMLWNELILLMTYSLKGYGIPTVTEYLILRK